MAQELKAFGIRGEENGRMYFAEVYTKKDVDAVLAEKDAEIAELKAKNAQLEDDVAFWKAKLEDAKATECRLNRELWQEKAETPDRLSTTPNP